MTTSFPVACPCPSCKGRKTKCLERRAAGVWVCPDSSAIVAVNLTEQDRAARNVKK